MKRRPKLMPPRVRKLYLEHRRLGLEPKQAAQWAWILIRYCPARDSYGHTSVKLANFKQS